MGFHGWNSMLLMKSNLKFDKAVSYVCTVCFKANVHVRQTTKVSFNGYYYFHTQTLVFNSYKSKEHCFVFSPRVHFCSSPRSKS